LTRSAAATERTCIVTRQTLPEGQLIRFVAGPDGEVVPDLKRRLPGRGAWITANAEAVKTAEKKKLFGRALEAQVTVAPGLAARIEAQLGSSLGSALSLARKAGNVVSGFGKVEAALEKGTVVALIHADDAAADGVRKLAAAARRQGGTIPELRFSREQLDLAFGEANVVHAALLAGPAGDNVLSRAGFLAAFRGEAAQLEGATDAPEALTRDAGP
jgi:predicted RNA-binding protein YlxR (DUF448 family)